MPKIFIVEDDDNIRELILYALKNEFDVGGFETPEAFWQRCKLELPDLLLLDIMLPGEDGLKILGKLKNDIKTKSLPIIMITAKNSEYDRVKGLDLGADDYVGKPFSVLELKSRINAVLRRTSSAEQDVLSFGGVLINPEKHTVLVNGELVTLTYKEFELLQYLMRNSGIVLSRDRIMSAVWGTDFEGMSRTVDMHIKTLRQKLGDGGSVIQTIRGVGYKVGE